MLRFTKKNILSIAGVALGAACGYMYYYFIGCKNGCAITSNPLHSTLYGSVIGGLLFKMFQKEKNVEQ